MKSSEPMRWPGPRGKAGEEPLGESWAGGCPSESLKNHQGGGGLENPVVSEVSMAQVGAMLVFKVGALHLHWVEMG